MVWLYIGVVLVVRVFQSFFNKKNANLVPTTTDTYLKYTIFYLGVAGICALLLVLFELGHGKMPFTALGPTALYASLSGIGLAVACCCSLYALSAGTVVLDSLFATAGLLVPTVAGIFMYEEILSLWQWLFVGVFLIGAYLLVGGSRKIYGGFSGKMLLSLIFSLLGNGLTMLMQTAFSRNIPHGNVSLFSFLSFAAGVVLLAILLPAVMGNAHRKEQSKNPIPRQALLFAFFLGVIVFIINQLATICANQISPVILFAFINGGATIVSAFVGLVIFKERLSLTGTIGAVLGITALVAIKFFSL